MLSPISASSSARGFLPDFFKSHAPDAGSQVHPLADCGGPRTSYLAERDGSHAEFCGGSQFALYREQMRGNLDFLIARGKQLGMSDAAEVEQRFNTFYRHRFEEAYYDTHAELIDSTGKHALDNFCAMLDDERLPPDHQRTAIRDLSQGVTVCAAATVSNLIAADRDLALSTGGMRGKLWQVKEDTVRNVLQELESQYFRGGRAYRSTEIHFVNRAWNYMADAVGLKPIPDPMVPDIDPDLLALWQDKVLDALSPDRLARKIAEDCLSEFRSRTVFDPESSSVPCDQAQTELLNMVLTDLLPDLGVTGSELNLHAFVQVDDDGQRYHVRDDPSLIALALLKVMNADHLLADTPVRVADIGEREGAHIALYSYGADLMWRLRQSVATAGAPAWEAHDDVDTIDQAELRAWLETQGPDAAPLPQAVVWKLMHDSDQQALMGILPNWLGTTANISGLLQRLQPAQALQYRRIHSEYLGTKFSREELEFLTGILAPEELLLAWHNRVGFGGSRNHGEFGADNNGR
ncbi:MAG TPA: hypothetical protein VL522_22335 [Bordetella sp.]|nr:hypothetical protein [Bordetella sp.]